MLGKMELEISKGWKSSQDRVRRRYMDNQWLIQRRKEQDDERIKELTSHVS
jgi:hypothetical protein